MTLETIALACAIAASAILSAPSAWQATLTLAAIALPACQVEDDNWCAWDAQARGNGEGHSFVTVNNRTFWRDSK